MNHWLGGRGSCSGGRKRNGESNVSTLPPVSASVGEEGVLLLVLRLHSREWKWSLDATSGTLVGRKECPRALLSGNR